MSIVVLATLSILAISVVSLGYLCRMGAVALLPESYAEMIRTAPLSAIVGIVVISLYAFLAAFAPLIAPFPEHAVVGDQFLPWDATFLLGTDNLGRDMLSRIIYGARNSVSIAFATTVLAFTIGTSLGLFAAVSGGWVDQALSRGVDVLMAIPALIFSLLLLTIFGTSVTMVILVIAVVDATRVFRLARSVGQGIVATDYIEAAKLRGEGFFRLTFREILPNAKAPLIAEFGLRFCFVFLTISVLSFLGVGVQPPTADWGSMLRDNATLITFGDITPLLPASMIAVLTVAVNIVVDWILHRTSGIKD